LLVFLLVSVLPARLSVASTSLDHPTKSPVATVRLPGHVLSAIAKASVVPSSSKSESGPISLTLVLKRNDQAGFERFLHDLYDPKSPNFHRFLTQRQIADRFGPSRSNYNSVLRWAKSKGFRLERGSKNRLTLTVRGTRTQAERAFAVNIGDYQFGKTRFFANDQDPAVPTQMASSVRSVIGLSNLAELGLKHGHMDIGIGGLKGCFAANSKADPNSPAGVLATVCGVAYLYAAIIYDLACFDQAEVTAGYVPCTPINILPLDKPRVGGASAKAARHLSDGSDQATPAVSSLPGAGQTVGLVEFDSYNQSDVSDFLALVNAAAQISQLNEVKIDGGAPIGSGESEVLLDIDTVMMLAPGANVSVYSAPFTGSGASFQTVLNQMIDDKVTVISNSWAYCEDETTAADVDSVDAIFQNAAAAGISAFNGAGDSGSTCLDGSTNTVAVPADSPHATAVGGSSIVLGPAGDYEGETWWNGIDSTPPTGQGGFGVSKFFSAPSYQTGLATMRSVPDVVANADPAANGVVICEADKGGCPTNLLFGGTSIAAPIWAAFTAVLNQAQGSNLGQINPLIYPLAGTDAFHSPVSMGSDFAHVGLGSPNLDALSLKLQGTTAGPVSASNSQASTPSFDVPDDGSSKAYVAVQLRDANGNVVSGKTVTLTATSGGHAEITPSSGVTSVANGGVIFSVTDLDPETVTFTADDMTDGTTLTPTGSPSLTFVTAPSTQAGLNAFPSTVTADGMTPADITITLEDSMGRPSPGKLVQLTQTGGSSVISGPVPPVTNALGTIEFTAVDSNNETITYSAVDVTDGSIPFPETGTVTFDSAPEAGCSNTMVAAPGFLATPYVTGLAAQSFSFGGVDFGGCPGAWGLAFDPSGNLYVSDLFNGNLYKIPSGGGVASPSTLVANIGTTLASLVFDSSGNLYGSRTATTGNFTTGAVMQINPSTGAIIRTVASNLTCPTALSLDPLSGDLFTDDSCSGGGSDDPALWEISGLGTGSPTTTVYANLPNTPNANIAFSPSGDMYIWDDGQGAMVTGTSGPNPPVVTSIAGLGQSFLGMQAYGTQANGDGQFLIANFPAGTSTTPNSPPTTNVFDLTTSPPSISTPILANGGGNGMTTGPDGCIYMAEGVAVWKITDTGGTCNYTAKNPPAALALTPATFSSEAAQGSPITLTAQFHNATAPTGTPIRFQVSGANPQLASVNSDSTGKAAFTYVAIKQGVDTIIASATLDSAPLESNDAVVTWGPGTDVTFVTLNGSPTSAPASQLVTVTANLTDLSANPPVALSGETVNFTIDGVGCGATTDSRGNASCQLTPSGTGLMTLAANFPGGGSLNPSSDTKEFLVVVPASATPTPTATATATATATLTPTPTSTPTPVVGKLKISPKKLNYGSVDIGDSPIKSVKITNAGKVKKKKVPLPILIEMESGASNPFTVTQDCDDRDLGPKSKGEAAGSCEVSVKFTPTDAMKYSGTLVIDTNLESMADRSVKLEGTGKAPKK
jgi:hypothetical protein